MTDTSALPDFDLMRFTPYRLAVAAQKTSEALARQYRARFDISIPEWRVLVHVAHAKDASVRDIEAQVVMEKSKVSRAATRLESIGYLKKSVNEGDRRLLRLSLTEKGQELMAELLPLAQSYQDEIEKQLGADFAKLEEGLQTMLARLEDPT
ncbi:MAG: winged helix-turn-helix transcriptional regulator [Pelagimonas sp.]